jgi:hypothetical protein
MTKPLANLMQIELPSPEQRAQLCRIARERRWGPALMLVGWLHLLAFGCCWYLTIAADYHDSAGYLSVWLGELCGVWLIFRLCGGARRLDQAVPPLETVIRRVWMAYFVLAFNLGSLNTLEGHHLFQLFPAMASLASFALIVMSVILDRRYLGAVLVMFAGGLLMAANLLHAYLIFAVAWWAVLNGIGLTLLRAGGQRSVNPPSPSQSAPSSRPACEPPAAGSVPPRPQPQPAP